MHKFFNGTDLEEEYAKILEVSESHDIFYLDLVRKRYMQHHHTCYLIGKTTENSI